MPAPPPKPPRPAPGQPFRRNPPGRRRQARRRAPTRAEAARSDELADVIEFGLARICREISDPTLTWREWHAQRALCTLATGKDRDHPCPELCRPGCLYLAAVRRGGAADLADPWWRAWRAGADGAQPAIRAAKRSNR